MNTPTARRTVTLYRNGVLRELRVIPHRGVFGTFETWADEIAELDMYPANWIGAGWELVE